MNISRTLVVGCLIVLFAAPVLAGGHGLSGQRGGMPQGYGQPTAEDFHALVMMLNLVLGDLEMLQMSLRSDPRYWNNLMSMGHLNNARSALSRAVIHPAYRPLLVEIDQRLGKIRFHLVMNDEQNARMMIAQLGAMMRTFITSKGGTTQAPPVIVGIPGAGGGWGHGQPVHPPITGSPIGLTPVSDAH